MRRTKITTVEKLIDCINNDCNDFVVILNHGLVSRKYITFSDEDGKDFEVFNLRDDSYDNFSKEELFDRNLTNIGEAMEKGAFFLEEDTYDVSLTQRELDLFSLICHDYKDGHRECKEQIHTVMNLEKSLVEQTNGRYEPDTAYDC